MARPTVRLGGSLGVGSLFVSLLDLLRPSVDWLRPAHVKEGGLLDSTHYSGDHPWGTHSQMWPEEHLTRAYQAGTQNSASQRSSCSQMLLWPQAMCMCRGPRSPQCVQSPRPDQLLTEAGPAGRGLWGLQTREDPCEAMCVLSGRARTSPRAQCHAALAFVLEEGRG